MNSLPLFKTEDLLRIIQDALLDYDGYIEDTPQDMYQSYSIDCDNVYENDEHCLCVTVSETSVHYPWQIGDIEEGINNKFIIRVECI